MLLNQADCECCTEQRSHCSATQLELVQKLEQYLAEHMEHKVTLEQLAERYFVSPSHIKNCVRCAYGLSFSSFVRTKKMESAASMLQQTDKTVLEVAGKHGYDNASKFAGAFKEVMGMSPSPMDGETVNGCVTGKNAVKEPA